MLKTSGSTEFITQPRKGRVGVGSDSRAGNDGKCMFDGNKIGGNKVDGDESRDNKDNEIRKKGQKMFKSKKTVGSLDILILEARLVSVKLR